MSKLDISKMKGIIGEASIIEKDEPNTIAINRLAPFLNHPFKPYNDEKMNNMVHSIIENGIINPLIVRSAKQKGMYEIISGHNRWEAAKLAGLREVPVIIKDVDDETASILMVDTNFNQREEILPSEKAFAYKIKLDAIKRQAGRPAKNLSHCVTNKRSDDLLAGKLNEGRMTIQRYIRLTELITPLLDKVDNNMLGFIPAVDISYLSREEQELLNTYLDITKIKPTKEQADQLKKKSQEQPLTTQDIQGVLDKKKATKQSAFSIKDNEFRSYFPKDMQKEITQEKAWQILEEAIQLWIEKNKI